jgi:hypothetical protein
MLASLTVRVKSIFSELFIRDFDILFREQCEFCLSGLVSRPRSGDFSRYRFGLRLANLAQRLPIELSAHTALYPAALVNQDMGAVRKGYSGVFVILAPLTTIRFTLDNAKIALIIRAAFRYRLFMINLARIARFKPHFSASLIAFGAFLGMFGFSVIFSVLFLVVTIFLESARRKTFQLR